MLVIGDPTGRIEGKMEAGTPLTRPKEAQSSSVMHPGDTKTWVHADDSNGELNVKKGGQGYLMYFNLAKNTN